MFKFGEVGKKTIEDATIHDVSVDFFLDLIDLYEEAVPGGDAPNYSDISDSLNTVANLIHNYYNSPIIDDKANLQYDISLGDFILIPGENDIRNIIVITADVRLPVRVDSYTGPDLNEIVGYEDLQFD